jgi:type I restriction enzyme R subunit
MINQGEALQNDDSTTNLLNIALEDVVFAFRKISEEEMQLGIVDRYKDQLRRTREAMQSNFDQQDPVFISLREELERLFAKRDLTEERTPAELENEIGILTSIYERITEQNRRDSLLRDKYGGDTKYARIHKRLIGPPPFRPDWSRREVAINTALIALKAQTDGKLELQRQLLKNEGFFRRGIERLVSTCFEDAKLSLDATAVEEISTIVAKEYLTEFERMAS